ncbi:polyketide cyclase/dehydrase/lipid transport protein [Rhodobacter aestuarii]|uniref:Polyketide cyclase / dehydrase and lipid transport n=1 Tax=Rhodobacter aestuarii TaxID=453582 RepID=A0A1N7NNM8_9RHOB|nr:SRPBCC family protein [Rhodobacter aestuarii]PTV94657.1 polyketide cyclase/dehydrase/lipid transport protein [Rhodobacter aestuarii]SIS99922.1 Polyketide cyclase / dehydrase and lipid transport [Rhodobacter aestuarii]
MGQPHSIAISAAPQAVFARYEAVETWPRWDPEVLEVYLPEGLLAGARGWLKPRKGPKSTIIVTEVDHGRSFTVESPLPFGTLRFHHRLEATDTGCTTTHWISFTGPLAFLFAMTAGRSIEAGLPQTLAGLKAECEGTEPPAPSSAQT